ncbi:unnamed protein product, partial [Discosporangium mesarthrocarpum]
RYVAVTNRCSSTSLLESRGPGLVMPQSFAPLPEGREPSAQEVLDELTNELMQRSTRCELEAHQPTEIVFAGLGEPLLRWGVVKEVVAKLRKSHQHLLLLPPHPPPPRHSSPRVGSAGIPEKTMIPIRLVTNGLGPLSQATAVTTIESEGSRTRDRHDYANDNGDQDQGDAAGGRSVFLLTPEALAKEIHHLFDSVSVALNTADPEQYEEV